MGCVQSSSADTISPIDRTALIESKKIESELKADGLIRKRQTRILLLGTGEAGKSSVCRQARRLYGQQFSEQERLDYVDAIWSNCLMSMRVVCEVMVQFGYELDSTQAQQAHSLVLRPDKVGELPTPQLADAIALLSAEPSIVKTIERRSEYQLNDSAQYFFSHAARISKPSFVPLDDDILRVRVRTIGIQEMALQINNRDLLFIDVGGQRSERRKWVSCFENIQVLLFVTAISEYDQTLREDKSVSRLVEAETLFDQTINSRWFAKSTVILFCNKVDLLAQKLGKVPLSQYLADYDSKNDKNFQVASTHLMERMTKLCRDPDKRIYKHFTCATDTKQIAKVLKSVIESQLMANFAEAASFKINGGLVL